MIIERTLPVKVDVNRGYCMVTCGYLNNGFGNYCHLFNKYLTCNKDHKHQSDYYYRCPDCIGSFGLYGKEI